MDFFEQDVIYKKKVNVTCDTGYFATGRLEIECLKDGTWSKAECRNGTYGIKPFSLVDSSNHHENTSV